MLPPISARLFGSSRISARNVTLLPEPDLAEQAQHLALLEHQIDIVDGMHRAFAGETHGEVFDVDEVCHARADLCLVMVGTSTVDHGSRFGAAVARTRYRHMAGDPMAVGADRRQFRCHG